MLSVLSHYNFVQYYLGHVRSVLSQDY